MRRRRAPVVVECDGGYHYLRLGLCGPGYAAGQRPADVAESFAATWAESCQHARARWLEDTASVVSTANRSWSGGTWFRKLLEAVDLTPVERALARPILRLDAAPLRPVPERDLDDQEVPPW